MAGPYRGLYLLGNKRAQTVRAVEIVDPAGRHTTVRLSEYISRGIQPEHKKLRWQEDMCSDAPIRSQHPEAEPAISGQAAYKRRGAADRGEHREAARVTRQAEHLNGNRSRRKRMDAAK